MIYREMLIRNFAAAKSIVAFFLCGFFAINYCFAQGVAKKRTIKKITVVQCGAKPDGTTDASAAFLKAVEMADTIIIPKGTYLIKGLNFKNVVKKYIVATNAIIKNSDNSVGTIVFDHGKNIGITGGEWTRLNLPVKEGKASENTFTFVGTTGIKVHGVFINNSPEMGICLMNVINAEISNNKITNCFRDGVYSHYSVNIKYIGNYLENIKDDALSIHDYGIVSQKPELLKFGYQQAGHGQVLNNTINNCYGGFSSIGCDGLVISGNTISKTVSSGINVINSETQFKGSTARAKNVTIKNNVLSFNGGTQQIMGMSYPNGGQYGVGRSAIVVATMDSTNTLFKGPERLSNMVITGNKVSNSFVNGASIFQVDGLVFSNNTFTDCYIDKSVYCGDIVEFISCTQAAINNNAVTDNRTVPLHHSGYSVDNVQGKLTGWTVKGYTVADHKLSNSELHH